MHWPFCTVSQSGTMNQGIFQGFPANLSDFLEGPGLEPSILFDSAAPAVCEFRDVNLGGAASIWHFPHGMQLLYRCWSFWMTVAEASNRTPVLLLPENRPNQPLSNFLTGFIDLLPRLKIAVVYNTSSPVVYGKNWLLTERPYAVLAPEHMAQMRNLTLLAFDKADLIPPSRCLPSSSGDSYTMPRFGILNRGMGPRQLLNAFEIANAVKKNFGNMDISFADFQSATFAEQVAFFASVDILLSPHGAQLTGIPFLPRCAAVVEIFPFGFSIPTFFGTLAQSSAIDHYFLYLGDGDGLNETAMLWDQRGKYRDVNLCLKAESVVEGLHHLISRWRDCCLHENPGVPGKDFHT